MIQSVLMKAIVQERYGSPDVLSVRDIDAPRVGDDDVLVRVRAASLNVLDWRKMRAAPFIVRMGEGFRRPKQPVLGVDASGVVEQVGKDVSHISTGDEVFGIGRGSFAEYTMGKNFAPKPANMTFEQAAALPVAGLTALQAIRDIGKVRPGQRVLVNGAGGGVGHLVVQVANAFDAHVTATTRTESLDFVRALGPEEVIDHSREDFRARDERYDVIIEIGGLLTFPGCRQVLGTEGRLVFVGAGAHRGGPIGRFLTASMRAKILRQPVAVFVSWETIDDLVALKDLVEQGVVTPMIDRTYPLVDAAEAVRFLESGRVRGKIVLTV